MQLASPNTLRNMTTASNFQAFFPSSYIDGWILSVGTGTKWSIRPALHIENDLHVLFHQNTTMVWWHRNVQCINIDHDTDFQLGTHLITSSTINVVVDSLGSIIHQTINLTRRSHFVFTSQQDVVTVKTISMCSPSIYYSHKFSDEQFM